MGVFAAMLAALASLVVLGARVEISADGGDPTISFDDTAPAVSRVECTAPAAAALTCTANITATDFMVAGSDMTVAQLLQSHVALQAEVAVLRQQLQQLLLPPPPPTPPQIPAAQSDDTFTVHALNLDCCRTGGEVPAVDAAGIQSTQRILTSLSACQTACQADPTCTYISFAQVWSNCLLCTGCSLNACCGGTSYVSYRRQLGTG